MPKSSLNEEMNNESLLEKGLKIIIRAFNEQKKEYSKNIFLLQSEIKKLKEENSIYKNKLTSLQEKLNSLSKTALLLDEDVEESKNEEEKKVLMQTLNTEFHFPNKTLINKNKNNNFSRNNRTSLGNNISNIKKKFKTNIFNDNVENKKNNDVKNINNNHKRTYSNNYKNLKYMINYQKKPIYKKAFNYLRNSTNNISENISNDFEINNNNLEEKIDLKDMEISNDNDNDSKLYNKLNLFLEECKSELNALDYENVLELLKSFETDSDIDIKKKIKSIISNRNKLIKLFDSIFDS